MTTNHIHESQAPEPIQCITQVILYKGEPWALKVNLPGTEDTMINQVVPSGGDLALHFAKLKLAISPNVGNSGA